MEIKFKKTREELPSNPDKRLLFISYCGRFCLGWFLKGRFVDTPYHDYDPDMVLMWIYEDDLLPDDFKEEYGR